MSDNNFFTIYWLGGQRQVISGPTVEEAFSRAGYGGGSIRAVDWYEKGINEEYYWDNQRRTWVKYVPLHIHASNFNEFTKEQLRAELEKHHAIFIDYDNQDQLLIKIDWGDFAQIGWTRYISIVYAEYFEGSYSGDPEDGDHHYMAMHAEYFAPEAIDAALEALHARFNNNPQRASGSGIQLEQIKAAQTQTF